ncbi:hypothetical protein HQ865_00595 [Mucilaginibacter mali]|uniref:Uncharacterized protein n=1 Tax=Mucilaginibacter mali TaxID=2740462 RepID=A0A7D4TV72_9SPHI|nr:hypothetical protein [Mucilaginibacter mali]QKJ28317.1 hypothetical protein HQ865_00595 [Mucilaginibacter mali]
MKGDIYIDTDLVGHADLKIIDQSMGAIGGWLIPNPLYERYRQRIQDLYKVQGIACSQDLNFKVMIGYITLEPAGGVGITDAAAFDEIYVEVAGLNLQLVGIENL